MGVIKNFSFGRTPPIFRASDESLSSAGLSIPSTPPSENEELPIDQRINLHPQRRDPALLIQRLEQISRKRTGARKARRDDNARILQTLAESDGEAAYSTPTIQDFIPYTENPLTKIVTDFNSMRIWQYFLSQSEEEQRNYLNDVSQKRITRPNFDKLGIPFTEAATGEYTSKDGGSGTTKETEKLKAPSISPEQRFSRVDSGLRSVLKRRNIPLGILSYLEEDVVDVFLEDDSAVYISQELDSFRRLLLHGISQYHLLNSWSVEIGGSRRTKVKNKFVGFVRPKLTLTEYLERRSRLLGHQS